MSKSSKINLVAAIFYNSASNVESGKADCKDIFTSFLAWSYPTSVRSWYALLTAYGLPAETITITAAISHRKGKKTTLASVDVLKGEPNVGNAINIPLRYEFSTEGFYTVHFNVVGTTQAMNVPVVVATQRWPHITKREREFLRSSATVPHSIRISASCSSCLTPYFFEENVLPDEPLAQGVLPFPESGELKCEPCSHILYLKDIQGQLRSSIKTAVVAAMRRGK